MRPDHGAVDERADVVVGAKPGGKAHVDLKVANLVALERAGVPPEAVDAGPECTSCDRARFFSYRRDKGETGQHLAFVSRLSAA